MIKCYFCGLQDLLVKPHKFYLSHYPEDTLAICHYCIRYIMQYSKDYSSMMYKQITKEQYLNYQVLK